MMQDLPEYDIGSTQTPRSSAAVPRLAKRRLNLRPRDVTPATVPRNSPTIRIGDLMLNESDAPNIAKEVEDALTALLQQNPTVIRRFEKTFHVRSSFAGVVESHKGSEGIERALAELFPSRFFLDSQNGSKDLERPDEKFVIEFRRAIKLLAERDPLALLMLKRNQLRRNCSLEEALQALFADYSRREAVYPY